MEVAIDHRAGGRRVRSVVERAPIGRLAVPGRITQWLPLLQEIKGARARAAVIAYTPMLKQALEHIDHLETQSELVAKVGEQNWLQSQMGEGSPS